MFYRAGITKCIEKKVHQRIRLSFKSTSSSNLNQTEEMMVKCVAVNTRAQLNVPRIKN